MGWNPGASTVSNQVHCSGVVPAAAGLQITLARPYTLYQVRIVGGLDPANRLASLQPRPQLIDLQFYPGGQCQRVTLADTAAGQTVSIPAIRATDVTVQIVSAYPPPAGRVGSANVSLSEITFFYRR